MYAVIKTGGKQYRIAAGEKLKIEQIAASVGSVIVFDQVLAAGDGATLIVGTPLVPNATVKATVLAQGRHDKVRIFKLRRRKHYKKSQGHRQAFTEVFIGEISDGKGGVTTSALAAVIPVGKDDLEIIEGIGPKIAKVLVDGGISSFALLASSKADDVSAMLKASGGRFSLANPASWAEQAALLRDGKMDEFKALTDALVGGVRK